MPVTSMVVVEHTGEASPDFVASLAFSHQHTPAFRKTEDGKFERSRDWKDAISNTKRDDEDSTIYFPEQLLVVDCFNVQRTFGALPADLVCFVLADGSNSLMYAFCNSALSYQLILDKEQINIGTLLSISKAEVIWFQQFPATMRCSLIIFDMSWKQPPNVLGNVVQESDIVWTRFRTKDVSRCKDNKEIIFMTKFKPDPYENFQVLRPEASSQMVARGSSDEFHDASFVVVPSIKKLVIEAMNQAYLCVDDEASEDYHPEDEVDEKPRKCDCVEEHGLLCCATIEAPLYLVDKDDLLHSLKKYILKKANGRVYSHNFRGLTQSHKRWCVYFWYATNVFQFDAASPLPSCVIQNIWKVYPNFEKNKPRTGFLSTEERMARNKKRGRFEEDLTLKETSG